MPDQGTQNRKIPTTKGREDVNRPSTLNSWRVPRAHSISDRSGTAHGACAAASPAASDPTPIHCSPLIISTSALSASFWTRDARIASFATAAFATSAMF